MDWLKNFIRGKTAVGVDNKITIGIQAGKGKSPLPTAASPVRVEVPNAQRQRTHAIPQPPPHLGRPGDGPRDSHHAHRLLGLTFKASPKATARWIPANQSVDVAGYRIPGGLIFVGDRLISQAEGFVQPGAPPCLINPALPVARRTATQKDGTLPYWPSYSEIGPSDRATYLQWLAEGRTDPSISIGFVFLFFYGLERRLLMDNPSPDEVNDIVSEVGRLLRIYSHGSFRSYATRLLSELHLRDLAARPGALEAWTFDLAEDPTPVAAALTAALSLRIMAGAPVPFDLLMAFALLHPSPLRNTRGMPPGEKEARRIYLMVMRRRFNHAFGSGFIFRGVYPAPQPTGYRPASRDIFVRSMPGLSIGAPDFARLDWSSFIELSEDVVDELTPYIRASKAKRLGPDSAEALASVPLDVLTDIASPKVAELRSWLGRLRPIASVDIGTLSKRFSDDTSTPAARMKQTKAITVLLARLGYGMEPNLLQPSGATVVAQSAWIYSAPGYNVEEILADQSHSTRIASVVLHILAVLAKSSPRLVVPQSLADELAQLMQMGQLETVRLRARAALFFELAEVSLPKKKALVGLDEDEHPEIARLVLAISTSRGMGSPSQISLLEAVFKLLKQDASLIYTAFHRGAAAPGEAIQIGALPSPSSSSAPHVLDDALIDLIRHETAKVGEVLSAVFTDDEGPQHEGHLEPKLPLETQHELVQAPLSEATSSEDASAIAGLSPSLAAFAMALMERDIWSSVDYAAEAKRHGLFSDGATESLNDWYFDLFDEAFVEEGEPMTINAAPYRAANGDAR